VSRITSHALKFWALCSLSPHLANFRPHIISRSAIALETISLPPPPVVLDPGPGAHHRLVAGSRACCRLDPGLRACRRHPLSQAVDLDPTSLGTCHHHPLHLAIELDPTPSNYATTVNLDPTPSTSSDGDSPLPSPITVVM
jgi:hypothetical protein